MREPTHWTNPTLRGFSPVIQPRHVALRGAAGVDEALELHARDHVGVSGVAVLAHAGGVVNRHADGDDDGADIDFYFLIFHVIVDAVLLTCFAALLAGERHIAETGVHVQHESGRDGLREGLVDGLPRLRARCRIHPALADRAHFGAVSAGGAFLLVNVARLAEHPHLEVAHVALDLFDLAVGQEFDQRMSTDIRHLRTQNSYGAVHCGIRLVDLRHDAAKGRLFLNQINGKPVLGKIERRLNAGHAAAHNQGRLLDRDHGLGLGLQPPRPRHAHPHQVLGLFGRPLLIMQVDPGALLPDVGHLHEVGV